MAVPPVISSVKDAEQYLDRFINKTIHIHITDGRLFVGQLKCTDNERNIIMAMTYEYRQPSTADIHRAAEGHERAGKSGNIKLDMKKRFVGLVVIPGRFITQMEVEE
ncbi:hypothetical protein M433DRAFT_3340 [Acidomyces richmondensis BFW]|nr:MAG: hypothetical protein FE78DRAFT_78239 [Acidomyces sp. 'richmondensis']KYG46892.1 hypothetical protein M433DRAFT_3340 [Acidomyces richmondensis BFW]